MDQLALRSLAAGPDHGPINLVQQGEGAPPCTDSLPAQIAAGIMWWFPVGQVLADLSQTQTQAMPSFPAGLASPAIGVDGQTSVISRNRKAAMKELLYMGLGTVVGAILVRACFAASHYALLQVRGRTAAGLSAFPPRLLTRPAPRTASTPGLVSLSAAAVATKVQTMSMSVGRLASGLHAVMDVVQQPGCPRSRPHRLLSKAVHTVARLDLDGTHAQHIAARLHAASTRAGKALSASADTTTWLPQILRRVAELVKHHVDAEIPHLSPRTKLAPSVIAALLNRVLQAGLTQPVSSWYTTAVRRIAFRATSDDALAQDILVDTFRALHTKECDKYAKGVAGHLGMSFLPMLVRGGTDSHTKTPSVWASTLVGLTVRSKLLSATPAQS